MAIHENFSRRSASNIQERLLLSTTCINIPSNAAEQNDVVKGFRDDCCLIRRSKIWARVK